MQTSDVLNKAADHIQQYGHHKGAALGGGHWSTASACTIGAISIAGTDAGGERNTVELAALAAMICHLGTGLVGWNDAPERTASEVVEALRAAALIEAAKEIDVRVVAPAGVQ